MTSKTKTNTSFFKPCLNSLQLKWIAMSLMVIDHIGAILLSPDTSLYWACRFFGRLSFPIFCFLIAEGFTHTRDVGKYMFRLGAFAFIAEIPYDLAVSRSISDPYYQNVFFTLLLGLISLVLYERFNNKNQRALGFIMVLPCALLATILGSDYGAFGVLLIFILYIFRNSWIVRDVACCGFSVFMSSAMALEWAASFALIPIHLYNGEKGQSRMPRWFFYTFYPLHLLVLWLISLL